MFPLLFYWYIVIVIDVIGNFWKVLSNGEKIFFLSLCLISGVYSFSQFFFPSRSFARRNAWYVIRTVVTFHKRRNGDPVEKTMCEFMESCGRFVPLDLLFHFRRRRQHIVIVVEREGERMRERWYLKKCIVVHKNEVAHSSFEDMPFLLGCMRKESGRILSTIMTMTTTTTMSMMTRRTMFQRDDAHRIRCHVSADGRAVLLTGGGLILQMPDLSAIGRILAM